MTDADQLDLFASPVAEVAAGEAAPALEQPEPDDWRPIEDIERARRLAEWEPQLGPKWLAHQAERRRMPDHAEMLAHAAALATAEHLAPGRVLILSARYGLIDTAEVVEPYDLRIDQAGAVTVPELVAQAHALDVHQARNVTVLTGAAYWHRARAVWPVATWPLEGLPGIGAHLRRLAELRRREEAAPLTLF